jgi:CheY-like chemotaxis protein
MPITDGMAFLRSLRATVAGAKVPVLMLTASQSAEDAWEARRLDTADWLVKPVSGQNVVAQVAATLGRLPPRLEENVLDRLVEEYEERLPREMLALQLLVADLDPGAAGLPPELAELHRRLHNVKGQAETLGYPLLGALAGPLHDLLGAALGRPEAGFAAYGEILKVLRVGLAGMKLVADRRLRGDGGNAGARMRAELAEYAGGLAGRLAA